MANTKFSKKSKVVMIHNKARKAIVPEVEVKGRFNKFEYVLTLSKVTDIVARKLEAGDKPPDAASKNNLHRVKLPGLEYPTSLGWAVQNLFGCPPVGVSERSQLPRGMYTPSQAMAALDKLTPCGVTLESISPNPQYQKWSAPARAILEANAKAETDAKAQAETEMRKAARNGKRKVRK